MQFEREDDLKLHIFTAKDMVHTFEVTPTQIFKKHMTPKYATIQHGMSWICMYRDVYKQKFSKTQSFIGKLD